MSRLSFSSLRVRLLFLVLLALVPAFGLLIYSAWEQRLIAAVTANDRALKVARRVVQEQRQMISQSRRLLGKLAQRPEIDLTNPATCSAYLASQLKEHPNYSNFGLIALDGSIKCSAVSGTGIINVSDRTYFRKTVKTHDFSVGDFVIGRVTGKATRPFGFPIFDSKGNLAGVLFAALELNTSSQILTQVALPVGSVLSVVDPTGTILARSVEPEKWIGKQSPLMRAILAQQGEGIFESQGVDGVERLYALSALVVTGKAAAYVVVGISKDVVYADVNRIFVYRLLLLGLVTVLVVALAWYGGDLFVVRQVNALVGASKRVASGDLSTRVAMPDGPGELNQLARSFDEMAEALERHDNQLNRTNRALRTISKCNDILVHATNESELLNETCRAIVENGGFRSAWVAYAEENDEKTIRPVAQSGFEPLYVETLKLSWADNEQGRGPTGIAIRTGKPSTVRSIQHESGHDHWRTEAVKRGYASCISLPLINNGKPFGVLTIYAGEPDAFDSENENLLTELAADLSYGITTLRTRTAHRESEERFRLLVGSVQDHAIMMLDHSGRIISWNTGAERIKGYKAEEIVGQHFSLFYTPEDIQADKPETALRVTESQGRYEDEGWRLRKDGSRFWASVSITAIRDEAGHSKGFATVARDLTERKQAQDKIIRLNNELEQRVIERTAQLEAANKELEAFSYSVSHDLRAPLRSIDGFSQALLEDYADKLEAEGKDFLQRVRASTQRMGELIDDMLNLSRVTRAEMRREPVDMTGMAQALAADLQKSAPDREVEFVIADGLTAQGDARLLRIVLDNLLGNAWKYTSKHPHARIEFGFAQNNGHSAYFVRDDGAGFDMVYADKLFGVFQRLHRQTEFSGTGVGLATVQRIMHRHGGRVWAEGELEKGATFYFTFSS